MQKIMGYIRKACQEFDLIENGDRIAVGVSGGKDSLVLLLALSELRKFLPRSFDIVAITVDMGFHTCEASPSPKCEHAEIRALCESLGVPFIVKETELAHIIFDLRRETNPCSLCSRMRRGILHDTAKEAGCNKVALGHHYDDAVETFMLNLFFEGRVGCFSPVTLLSKKELTLIRPLVMTEEKMIKHFAKTVSLPVEKSPCPEDEHTERENMKQYLADFDHKHRGLYRRLLGALERGNIDGWHE
ncbi:MAG: adenine nucleotide alpha hydrolase family protein [Clostridia bacterium]|nr:adenine nucleotide alpha hydrolase family protein [Clostridia bacterium]